MFVRKNVQIILTPIFTNQLSTLTDIFTLHITSPAHSVGFTYPPPPPPTKNQ